MNPGRVHLEAALRVLRYLKGTKTRARRSAIADIAGFTDSYWAGDRDYRKLISAYKFRMRDGIVSWKSKKRASVALSLVEAE